MGLMKRFFLSFAARAFLCFALLHLSGTFVLAQPAAPAKATAPVEIPLEVTRVGEIKFEGLQSRTPAELIPKLSTKVGEPYNALLLSEDISKLAEMMRLVTARTEP